MTGIWSATDNQNVNGGGTDVVVSTGVDGSFARGDSTLLRTTGNLYIEYTYTGGAGLLNIYTSVGIASQTYTITDQIPGHDSAGQSITLGGDGGLYRAGTQLVVLGTPLNGDIVAYHIDVDNGRLWVRLWDTSAANWQSDWNASPTADPVARTGYVSIAVQSWLPIFGALQTTEQGGILKTGPFGFLPGMPLSGYNAWGQAGGNTFVPKSSRGGLDFGKTVTSADTSKVLRWL